MSAPNECPACGAAMAKLSDWVDSCPNCNYMNSSLAPGSSPLGEGFEELRRSNFELLLDWLGDYVNLKGLSTLEVGCGRGWFLEAAVRRGMIVRGIEPGSDGEIARHNGFNVDIGFFPADLSHRGPFDMIIFNDVFEHIPNPVPSIRSVSDLLAVGGVAVFNLPSSDGVFFKIARVLNSIGISGPYHRLWQKGLASPHMSYFNANNLSQLAERHTKMIPIGRTSLPSVSRAGLHDRIKISFPGWRGDAMFYAVWLGSFVLRFFPSDIAVLALKRVA
jgi:2-polyprenyl-3-methyl-5-hydroxy-6-metoxy-1,4-benzoquinol methylase